MINKKFFVIFTLSICFMLCVGAISAASDDLIDEGVSEIDSADDSVSISNDEQAIDVDSSESALDAESSSDDVADEEMLAASDDDSDLAIDPSEEKLAVTASYDLYSITLEDAYIIEAYSKGTIEGYVSTPYTYMPQAGFKIYIYDEDENLLYTSKSFTGYNFDFTMSIPAQYFLPGVYDIYAVNDWDGKIMAESVLGVGGVAVFTSSNFNGNYMSGKQMTATIRDKVSGKPLTSLAVKAVFTKGKSTVTRVYYPDSNGKISFVPPVGVGTWKVTFSTYFDYLITGSAVKTAKITKSKVSIKAYKVTEYKGYKTTLKAVVKSNGKKVNEGTVKFKINGKTYKASVKNGVATVKVKLSKIKTYKYTAVFSGANFKTSKKVKAKAVLKKPFKTKVSMKNQAVYAFQSKTVKISVKTTTGKKVKNGKLKVTYAGNTEYVTVKNGVAKLKVTGLHIMKHFVGFTSSGETYKKAIVIKYKIKYVPSTHKYKSSKTSAKVTSRYICELDHKTSTHTHRAWSGTYWYSHIMSVK